MTALASMSVGVLLGVAVTTVATLIRDARRAPTLDPADGLAALARARDLGLPGFEFVVDGSVQVGESLLRLHLARARVGRVAGWGTRHTADALAALDDLEQALAASSPTSVKVIPIRSPHPRRWN